MKKIKTFAIAFIMIVPLFTKSQGISDPISDYFSIEETFIENNNAYYQLEFAINNSKTIGLTETNIIELSGGIDSMKARELEFLKMNPGVKFNSRPYQNKYLNKILTDEQYCVFIILKNKVKAHEKAKRDWDEFVEKGLSKGYDQIKTIKEFEKFYIGKAFAYGRYETREKMRKKYLDNLYNSQSAAGVQLYFARQDDTKKDRNKKSDKSQLMLAIENSYKLELTPVQLKQLLDKLNELNAVKDSAFIKDFEKKFDLTADEMKSLEEILTDNQLKLFVSLKNSLVNTYVSRGRPSLR
ncbi:MAG: hypothetical protein ABI402_05885 [Ferruginibacter sp.]